MKTNFFSSKKNIFLLIGIIILVLICLYLFKRYFISNLIKNIEIENTYETYSGTEITEGEIGTIFNKTTELFFFSNNIASQKDILSDLFLQEKGKEVDDILNNLNGQLVLENIDSNKLHIGGFRELYNKQLENNQLDIFGNYENLRITYSLIFEKGGWKIIYFSINGGDMLPNYKLAVSLTKQTTDKFILAFKENKLQDFYNGLLSSEFKGKISEDDFIQWASNLLTLSNKNPNLTLETDENMISIENMSLNNYTYDIVGDFINKLGVKIKYSIGFVEEGENYKIQYLQYTWDSDT